MYEKTATVFNKYISQKKTYWYPHVISGVDLITDKGANIAKTGMESADAANLHVKYHTVDDTVMVGDYIWLPPKEWKKQVNENLPKSITFESGDFFMLGTYPTDVIADENYESGISSTGFYDFMNKNHDFVFLITNVGGPYTLIPHFEIGGK